MATAPGTVRRGPSGATVVLLVLAVLVYLFVLSNAVETPCPDPINKGIAAIYDLIGIVLLWLVARELLQRAQAICKPSSVEYVAAKFELARLPP